MAMATGLAVEAESAGVAVPAATLGKGKDHGDFVFPIIRFDVGVSPGGQFAEQNQVALVHYTY